ncbi:MAG TPA: FAD-binding protein, partial [Candidatus Competibacter sp.]|nr:FAD-binding protein [Candidatus Competibacter sp.]
VAADRGWLAAERFIGSTGQIVAPKLYMAFGVSGAGQHLSGITGSETVIAVNNDRTAPMLKRADLGIVGDLHQILPILLGKLQALAAVNAENHSESTAPTDASVAHRTLEMTP